MAEQFLDQLEGQTADDLLQMSFGELFVDDEEEQSAPVTSNQQYQLEDTEPSATGKAPAQTVSGRHQDIRLYITVLLKTYVEATDAGIVRDTPFEVRLDEHTRCAPDIAFMTHSNYKRVHETHIDGPPDIIVEVSTSESVAIDRGEKFVLYESYGVREYWLIDPERELAYFYHLGPDQLYDDARPDISGRLRSRVLKGFTLDVPKLWGRVLPTTVETVELVKDMIQTR